MRSGSAAMSRARRLCRPAREFHRAFHHVEEFGRAKRFFQTEYVVQACFREKVERRPLRLPELDPRNRDDWKLRIACPQLLDDLHAIELWHVDVDDHQVELASLKFRQSRLSIADRGDFEPA